MIDVALLLLELLTSKKNASHIRKMMGFAVPANPQLHIIPNIIKPHFDIKKIDKNVLSLIAPMVFSMEKFIGR